MAAVFQRGHSSIGYELNLSKPITLKTRIRSEIDLLVYNLYGSTYEEDFFEVCCTENWPFVL